MAAVLELWAKGLHALGGVLLGLALVATRSFPAHLLPPLLGLVLLSALLYLAYALVLRWPRLALALVELWGLSALLVVALSSAIVLDFTLQASSWFALDKPRLDAVSGALVGAITTYLATVWTDDIKNAKSPFLASVQFKTLLAQHFSPHYQLSGDTLVLEACHHDNVRDGTSGWGLGARWKRAAILAGFLKALAPRRLGSKPPGTA